MPAALSVDVDGNLFLSLVNLVVFVLDSHFYGGLMAKIVDFDGIEDSDPDDAVDVVLNYTHAVSVSVAVAVEVEQICLGAGLVAKLSQFFAFAVLGFSAFVVLSVFGPREQCWRLSFCSLDIAPS